MRPIEPLVAMLLVAPLGCEPNMTGPQNRPEAPAAAEVATTGVAGAASGSAHLTAFPPEVEPRPGLALRNFAFSAVKHADGSVTGQWQIVAGGSILHGPIDCLTIAADGGSARISGLVTNVTFTSFLPGTAFAMELVDGGSGASGEPDVTTQLRAFRNADPAVGRAFCESGAIPSGAELDPLPTEHGNLTIHDR